VTKLKGGGWKRKMNISSPLLRIKKEEESSKGQAGKEKNKDSIKGVVIS
jgi:hypothetical protein